MLNIGKGGFGGLSVFCIRHCFHTFGKIIQNFGELPVFLIHPLMINVLEKLGFTVTPAAPVLSLLVFYAALAVVCFALVLVLRKVPVLKRLF